MEEIVLFGSEFLLTNQNEIY